MVGTRYKCESRGRGLIGKNMIASGSHASQRGYLRTLDTLAEESMMSVYCVCGRIVVLDRSEMKLRLNLGKELECSSCRNRRISHEIDVMNDHFNGIEEPDGLLLRWVQIHNSIMIYE